MSVGFGITFIGLLTRRYIEQTPHPLLGRTQSLAGRRCMQRNKKNLFASWPLGHSSGTLASSLDGFLSPKSPTDYSMHGKS